MPRIKAMTNRLFLLRHGIRGVRLVTDQSPGCLPLLNDDMSLSLFGHIHSYRQGRWIRENYGSPTFLYGDRKDERTVSTTVAIAKGSNSDLVWLSRERIDPFFRSDYERTPRVVAAQRDALRMLNPVVESIADLISTLLPCVTLPDQSAISEDGTVSGLAKTVGQMAQLPTFSILSNVDTPLVRNRRAIESAYTVKTQLEYPIFGECAHIARSLLSNLIGILLEEPLSVVIGHDTNIALLSRLLGKPYQVPGHAHHYVPPNSGFLLTLMDPYEYVSIDVTWLDLNGQFNVAPLKINVPLSEIPSTSARVKDGLFRSRV